MKKKKAQRSAPRSFSPTADSSRNAYGNLANRGIKWNAKVGGKVLLVASLALLVTSLPIYLLWVTPNQNSSSTSPAAGTTVNPAFSRYLAGENQQSSQQSVAQAFEAPSLAPISAPSSNGKVTLTWTPVAGAGMYLIYRNSTPITSVAGWEQGYTDVVVGSSVATWVDANPARGMNYYAVVAAVVGGPRTPVSNWEGVNVILAPPAPTSLAAPANPDSTTFGLSWNAADQATAYNVYESTTPITSVSGMTPIATVTTTTLQIGPVAVGTYFFAVTGVNTAGEGAIATVGPISVQTPVAPTWVTVNGTVSASDVSLQWTASATATSYSVYENNVVKADTTDTSIVIFNLANDTTYSFTVSAWNGVGEGSQSAPISITSLTINVCNDGANFAVGNTLSPQIRTLVLKGIDTVSTAVATATKSNSSIQNDIVKYINEFGPLVHFSYSIGCGDYQISPGVKVALSVGLNVSVNTGLEYIDFVISPTAAGTFQLDSGFGALSSLISTLSQYGITVTPSITVTGSVELYIYYGSVSQPAGTVAVQSISIDIKPQLVIQGEWLKAILAAVCPAAEAAVSAIASVIKTLTGYDLMSILTSTITITVEIKDTYNFGTKVDTLFMSLMVNVVAISLNLPFSLGNFEAGGVGYIQGTWASNQNGIAYSGYVYVFYDYKLAGHSGSGKYYLTQF